MLSRTRFLTAALPESSLQGTSIYLQSNLIHERVTIQEQNKVSLHPDSSEYQGDDLGEEVRSSSEELHPVSMEIDLNVGEVVRDQAEAMSTGKYSLVAGLFNQNSPIPKTSGYLSSHYPSQSVGYLSSHYSSQSVKAAHST